MGAVIRRKPRTNKELEETRKLLDQYDEDQDL